jgi:hypothetical protein
MANCKECRQTIYWREDGKKDDGTPRWIPHDDVGLSIRHECPKRNKAAHFRHERVLDEAEARATIEDVSGVSLLRIDQKLDHIIEILESLGVQL